MSSILHSVRPRQQPSFPNCAAAKMQLRRNPKPSRLLADDDFLTNLDDIDTRKALFGHKSCRGSKLPLACVIAQQHTTRAQQVAPTNIGAQQQEAAAFSLCLLSSPPLLQSNNRESCPQEGDEDEDDAQVALSLLMLSKSPMSDVAAGSQQDKPRKIRFKIMGCTPMSDVAGAGAEIFANSSPKSACCQTGSQQNKPSKIRLKILMPATSSMDRPPMSDVAGAEISPKSAICCPTISTGSQQNKTTSKIRFKILMPASMDDKLKLPQQYCRGDGGHLSKKHKSNNYVY